jgi:hypothetical protein
MLPTFLDKIVDRGLINAAGFGLSVVTAFAGVAAYTLAETVLFRLLANQ